VRGAHWGFGGVVPVCPILIAAGLLVVVATSLADMSDCAVPPVLTHQAPAAGQARPAAAAMPRRRSASPRCLTVLEQFFLHIGLEIQRGLTLDAFFLKKNDDVPLN
jgi:hypothetical protein